MDKEKLIYNNRLAIMGAKRYAGIATVLLVSAALIYFFAPIDDFYKNGVLFFSGLYSALAFLNFIGFANEKRITKKKLKELEDEEGHDTIETKEDDS